MKVFFTVIAFAFVVHHATAQTLDHPIYLNFSSIPSAETDNGTELNTRYLEANLATPIIKLGKRTQWINTLYYRNSNFDFNNAHPFANNLHDIRYTSIFRTKLSEKLELISIGRLLVRSNLQEGISGNDLFPFALVSVNYAIKGNPDFTVGLGVALNSDFRHNAIIPIVSLRYESKKMKIEAVYPNVNVLYKSSENLEFGLFANIDGSISHITNTNLIANSDRFQRNLQLSIAPTVSYRLFNQIFGHLKVGISPINNLQILDENYEEIPQYTQEFAASLFFRAGISYRLKK